MLDPENDPLTADPPDPEETTGSRATKTLTAESEEEEVIEVDSANAFAPPLKPADPPDTAGGG